MSFDYDENPPLRGQRLGLSQVVHIDSFQRSGENAKGFMGAP